MTYLSAEVGTGFDQPTPQASATERREIDILVTIGLEPEDTIDLAELTERVVKALNP